MSKARFAAAKELINEKRFAEARMLLNTIDHPLAKEWLTKLNRLEGRNTSSNNRVYSPPPPPAPPIAYNVHGQYNDEQFAYYRRQNRHARGNAVWKGIQLIFVGLVCIAAFVFFAWPHVDLRTGQTIINPGISYLFVPLGILAGYLGIREIRR